MKRVLSGIQPSGEMTIGNFFGAIKEWVRLSNSRDYDSIFMVANMHVITVKCEPEVLCNNSYYLLAMLISCGVNFDKSPIFLQSDIPAHAQLSWILSCNTYIGEMQRMTQFKDKSQKNEDNINVGLFTYPILMAADILLYQADLIPVGQDQKQHVEITRDIAIRFNNKFGQTFKIPEPSIPEISAKIMSLQNPKEKMSKSSDNKNSYILLTDEKDEVLRKIRRSVTDDENCIKYDNNKPGIQNLMIIYRSLTDKTFDEIEKEFENSNYSTFKEGVAESLSELLLPIQKKFNEIKDDRTYLRKIYEDGRMAADEIAKTTLKDIWSKIGFLI